MAANQLELETGPRPQVIECPKCAAHMWFNRTLIARIDGSGFESYRFDCISCAVPLAGVVDPYDGTLLLSELS
jgi:hypothetical protein